MANESFVTENTLTDIPQEVLDEATNFYEDKNVIKINKVEEYLNILKMNSNNYSLNTNFIN